MMERLRELPPWQIILLAVGILVLVLVIGYFAVVTVSKPSMSTGKTTSTIPADLRSTQNQDVIKKLQNFQAPKDIPQPNPIRTVDPNNPNQAPNPFR